MNHPTLWGQSSSAAGQAVPDSVPVIVPDGGALRLIRATVPYISNGYPTPQARASAAPPGKLYQAPFPLLCRVAATPYPAYLHSSSKACASRGIPVASPESPHPHDDTFVYSLIYQAESLKLKTM